MVVTSIAKATSKPAEKRSALNGCVPESTVVTGDKAVGRAFARQRRRVKTRPTKHLDVHPELLLSHFT